MKKHSFYILTALIVTMTFLTIISCGSSKGDSPTELKLDHRKILQNHFKDKFVNVDNTSDIDEKIIIIDSIKEGIFKLEVEEEKGLLTNLETGSLIELEESLKGLTDNVLLNNSKKAEAWYLLGRLYDLMVYDVEFNQKSKEAFDRCEKLEQNNPDRLELFGRIHLSDDAKEAIDHFSRAIKYIEEKEAENENYPPQLIRLYRYLGTAYYHNSEYDKALEYLEQGLAMADGYYKTPQLVQVEYYIDIGAVYAKEDKHEEAISFYLEAHNILTKINKDTFLMGVIHNKLGLAYSRQNDNKAEHHYIKALDIYQGYYGEYNSRLVIPNKNLATFYAKNNNYIKSLIYHKKALKIIEDNSSFYTTDHIEQYLYIAGSHKSLQNFDKAEYYYNNALKASLEINDYYNEVNIKIFNNMASFYSTKGLYKEAIINQKKSIDIATHIFSEPTPQVAILYNNMGTYLEDSKLSKEAIMNFKKAIEIYKSNDMSNSVNIANTYQNLAISYFYVEEYQKAHDVALLAYEIYKKEYGAKHSDTKSVKEDLNIIKEKLP